MRATGPEDAVLIHYAGFATGGRKFDTTAGGPPARLHPSALIKGLSEGLALMVEGDRFRFWVPSPLAYGARPLPGQPAGMLVFDVELIEIQ